ncbi:CYP2C8 [Branchiostoma lanceolatum]|uniref:CYP2C8 protein n=1 Tax=Branchiostoma lanceolatum TaxID=7740 RepID=A0A8J9Z1V4_BRALA|nr:CYP2C8 [Branchiostoma lanceolatum]
MLQAFIRDEMDDHRATLGPANPRDFTDCLLRLTKPNPTGGYTEEHLVQDELDRVVGRDGGLSFIRHRLQLPYIEATVLDPPGVATARWTDEFVLRRKLSYNILKSSGMRLSPGHAEDVVLEESNCLCQKAFIRDEMEDHRATLGPANPRDFTDCLLRLTKPNPTGGYTEEHLVFFVAILFTAGTERR